ncbi:hypothetical protein PMIN06_005990 [Paraphaeosphaeria minitans]
MVPSASIWYDTWPRWITLVLRICDGSSRSPLGDKNCSGPRSHSRSILNTDNVLDMILLETSSLPDMQHESSPATTKESRENLMAMGEEMLGRLPVRACDAERTWFALR